MIPLAKVFGNIIALRVHKNRATGDAVVQGPVALFERTTLISALHGHSAFNLPLESRDVQARVVFVLPLRFGSASNL